VPWQSFSRYGDDPMIEVCDDRRLASLKVAEDGGTLDARVRPFDTDACLRKVCSPTSIFLLLVGWD
jgi:hypothetical protein